MMKKLLVLLLTALLAFSLAACDDGGNGGTIGEEKDDGTYDKTFPCSLATLRNGRHLMKAM